MKKPLREITGEDVVHIASLITTKDFDQVTETTIAEKYKHDLPELFSHAKSYAINSIYFQRDVYDYLLSKGYGMLEYKERPNHAYKITNTEELFSRSLDLTLQIQNQFNLIQNENVEVFDSELSRFKQRIDNLIGDLRKLKIDTVNHIKTHKIK